MKRSRFVKTLAFILACLTFSTVILNAVIMVFALNQNLYTKDETMIRKKLSSFAAEITSNDLINYYYLSADDNKYTDYYIKNELEIYQSKYSSQNSNLAFQIKDENGKILLSNYPMNDPLITISRVFPIYQFVKGTETVTTAEEEETTEIDFAPVSSETDPEPNESETEFQSETETETTSLPEPSTALDKKTYSVYIDNATDYDNEYILKYVFPKGQLNDHILSYCRTLYRENNNAMYSYGTTDDTYIVLNQTDFDVSENGFPYYIGDNNGFDPYEEDSATQYYDEQTSVDYSVVVMIPKAADASVKDIVYYTFRLSDVLTNYLGMIIPLSVTLLIISVLLLIFVFCAAGYVKNCDEPVARGLHKIPTDILMILFIVFASVILIFIDEAEYLIDRSEYASFLLLTAAETVFTVTSLTACLEAFAVKIKTKTFFKNMLTVKLFKFIFGLCITLSENSSMVVKASVIYAAVTALELLYVLNTIEEALVVIYVLLKLLCLPVFAVILIDHNEIRKGAEAISRGDIHYKIRNKLLFGEFRKNAENLNSISDGINTAVNERLKSESMKTELITNVSHDLKTPLTSIVNYVDLLKKEKIENEKAVEYIGVIDRQTQKLKRMTSDIVDASKAATGNLDMHFEKTDLAVIVSQTVGEYDEKLKARSLTLITDIPERNVYISADGKYLWRVFDNLMNNICKYSLEGTRVYITLGTDGSSAEITFRNISSKELNLTPEELTERFVRGDKSRNTEGSGLGLSIAKSLTERMNGTFDVFIDGDLFKIRLKFPEIK